MTKEELASLLNGNEYREEISDKLNIPQETVNSRMKNALKILKDKFSNTFYE